jgi:hypothetical protein
MRKETCIIILVRTKNNTARNNSETKTVENIPLNGAVASIVPAPLGACIIRLQSLLTAVLVGAHLTGQRDR